MGVVKTTTKDFSYSARLDFGLNFLIADPASLISNAVMFIASILTILFAVTHQLSIQAFVTLEQVRRAALIGQRANLVIRDADISTRMRGKWAYVSTGFIGTRIVRKSRSIATGMIDLWRDRTKVDGWTHITVDFI